MSNQPRTTQPLLSEGGSPSTPADRIRRVRSFVDCLRDSFDVAGAYYSRHLSERTAVCDYVNHELLVVAEHLEKVAKKERISSPADQQLMENKG